MLARLIARENCRAVAARELTIFSQMVYHTNNRWKTNGHS
jgi:hypothetical protein